MIFSRTFFASGPPQSLRLTGLLLRQPSMHDHAAWAELRGLSRAYLTPWEPTWAVDELDRLAFRRRIRANHADWRTGTGYGYFVLDAMSHQLLGGVTLGNIRRGAAQSASIGYWIGQPYTGRGMMTAAVGAVLQVAFERLALNRVEAACRPANAASLRVLEKNGFRREGLARGYLQVDGAWHDHVLLAILADEWRQRGQDHARPTT